MVHHDVPELKELPLFEGLREQVSNHRRGRYQVWLQQYHQDCALNHTSHSKKSLLSAQLPLPDWQFECGVSELTESKGKGQCGPPALLSVRVQCSTAY